MHHLDTVFSPGLYLDRDKQAFSYIVDRLLHQESCASVCMYGNGKDYLFGNVVRHLETLKITHQLKVLNTVSADELKEFADTLEADSTPTLCVVNIRTRQDISWLMDVLERLRVQRGHAFVSYVSTYVGDVYQALMAMRPGLTHSMQILPRIDCDDAQHILDELSERFDWKPTTRQADDIYAWSHGHVGLLRTLFLLKRQRPEQDFTATRLLGEPTVLERLMAIIGDMPTEMLDAIQDSRLKHVEKTLLQTFGYIDSEGKLFHPLLVPLLPRRPTDTSSLSLTEQRVLAYLRERPDEIISRDDIARIVWGEEEWQDKYSDWAIGQLIYRLRRKLADANARNATIETRKGVGFIFTH